MDKKTSKLYLLFYIYVGITLVLAHLIVIYIMFYAFYPFKTITILKNPVPVLHKEFKRGDSLKYLLSYQKFRDYEAEITRWIECKDSNLVTLSPDHASLPVGKYYDVLQNGITIPQKTSLTECKLVVNELIIINAIRKIKVSFETEYFKVTE